MTVRAKFTVNRISRSMGSKRRRNDDGSVFKNERGHEVYDLCEMWTVEMSPVYGHGDPNHENTKFWEASPSGSLQLGTVNKAAVEQFELGKEYYIDFAPAS